MGEKQPSKRLGCRPTEYACDRYWSTLQVGGIADLYHLAEVMHLCEDAESLGSLVAQGALLKGRGPSGPNGQSAGVLELAMHRHLVRLGQLSRAAEVVSTLCGKCDVYLISRAVRITPLKNDGDHSFRRRFRPSRNLLSVFSCRFSASWRQENSEKTEKKATKMEVEKFCGAL